MNVSTNHTRLLDGLRLPVLQASGEVSSETMNLVVKLCILQPEHPVCEQGLYGYKISYAANLFYLILFTLLFMCYAIVGRRVSRDAADFTITMCLGLVCEIIGYAARLKSTQNQFDNVPFFMQVCTLTIGPAFMAAALYILMRRMVYCFGDNMSLLSAKNWTRIFIPCDVISLTLQATGGGIAAAAYENGNSIEVGDWIMIAGLTFQVFTMSLFTFLCVLYGVTVLITYRECRRENVPRNAALMRHSRDPGLYLFLSSFFVATICILVRCCYRVAELSRGWGGGLARDQGLFMTFEATMVFIACTILVAFHPAYKCNFIFTTPGGGFHNYMPRIAPRDFKPRISEFLARRRRRRSNAISGPAEHSGTELDHVNRLPYARLDGALDLGWAPSPRLPAPPGQAIPLGPMYPHASNAPSTLLMRWLAGCFDNSRVMPQETALTIGDAGGKHSRLSSLALISEQK